jgi:hypothetical protein
MIAEPMTLLTDYVLAGVTGGLGWRLFSAREGQAARSRCSTSVLGACETALIEKRACEERDRVSMDA